MLKLMIRSLVISFTVLILVSCKTYTIQGVTQTEKVNSTFTNRYFLDPNLDYVYKAHIEVYGNDLSGIFIVKKINDSVHRIVLTTDFGNRLLDFELSKSSFKVNFILDNLDKKIIINTLEKDFRLLLDADHKICEVLQSDDYIIYKEKDGKEMNFYFENREDGSLIKLVNASKSKQKVTFSFMPKNTTFAESILIQHHNIKLKIELNQISN